MTTLTASQCSAPVHTMRRHCATVVTMMQQQCNCDNVQQQCSAHLEISCSEDFASVMRRSHGSGGSALACHTAPAAINRVAPRTYMQEWSTTDAVVHGTLLTLLRHAAGLARTICIGHLLPSLRQRLTEAGAVLQAALGHHGQPRRATHWCAHCSMCHLQHTEEHPTCRLVRRSIAVKVPLPATLRNVMDTNPPAVARYPWILTMTGPAGWHSTCA